MLLLIIYLPYPTDTLFLFYYIFIMATSSSASNSKTNAILAWLFAPITSLIWMNDADEFLKHHAKQSLYWGAFTLIVYVGGFILSTLLAFVTFGLGSLLYCLIFPFSILDIVVRIMGIVKSNNGEKWVVPVIGKMVK